MLNFALALSAGALKAQYSTTINQHISEFMPVFQNPTLNGEWNSRMSSQRFLRCPVNGDIVHQQYALPWPLKPRELLMSCTSAVLHREQAVVSTCHSAHSDLVPVTDEAVRMEILESNWRFTALPRGRTRILVDLTISEKYSVGIPTFVIKYVQDHSLKDSVHAFLKASRRLKLPPTSSFVSWARTRAEAKAATAALAAAGGSADRGADSPAAWRRASAALAEATQMPVAMLFATLLAGMSSWIAYAHLRRQQRLRERQKREQKASALTLGNTPWWFSYTTFQQRMRQRRAAMRTSRELRRMRHRLSYWPGRVRTTIRSAIPVKVSGVCEEGVSRSCSLSQGIDRYFNTGGDLSETISMRDGLGDELRDVLTERLLMGVAHTESAQSTEAILCAATELDEHGMPCKRSLSANNLTARGG